MIKNKLNHYVNYIKIIYKFLILHVKSAMEYKKSFIFQVAGMILNNTAFIIFWFVIYNKFRTSFLESNIQFKEIMLIWAVASSGYGIANTIFGGAGELAYLIYNGIIDVYLIYPKNPLFIILLSRSSISAWGDFLFGYIIFIIFVNKSLLSILLFTFFIILSGFALAIILVILNSLSFFIGNSEKLTHSVYNSLLLFSTYPQNIFSPLIKFILFSIFPVGIYVYLPVSLILNFNFKIFLLLFLLDFIFLLIAIILFKKGLQKYESGNLFYTNK